MVAAAGQAFGGGDIQLTLQDIGERGARMNLGAKVEAKVRRATRLSALLAAEGNPVAAAKWMALSALGIRKELPIKIGGIPVTIRTSSTDADVSTVSLRGEFDDLFAAVPRLRYDFIVDAGGYIGTAAIAFARAYPDATIVTLEPSEQNFALLCKNTRDYPNIRPINAALGNTAGRVELRNRGTGHSGFTVVGEPEDNPDGGVLHSIECVTIPDLKKEFGREGVDILKLDIEGGEFALLKDVPGWMESVGAVCIELHDRIVSGCTDAYVAATAGRRNIDLDGEKYLSIHPDFVPA